MKKVVLFLMLSAFMVGLAGCSSDTLVGTRWVMVLDGEMASGSVFFGTETTVTFRDGGEMWVREYRYSRSNVYMNEGAPFGEILWGTRSGNKIFLIGFDENTHLLRIE